MQIYDEQGSLLEHVDPTLGRVVEEVERILHPPVPERREVGHYEVVRAYPGGGKDVKWVVDVPGVRPQPAREEERVRRVFIPFTPGELAELRRPTLEARLEKLETFFEALLKKEVL